MPSDRAAILIGAYSRILTRHEFSLIGYEVFLISANVTANFVELSSIREAASRAASR
jgi:hypothetical protein